MTDADDVSLTEGLADDLDVHFALLVEAYGDRLYAFALRLRGHPQDAQEILQDTFLRAYRGLAQYEPARRRDLRLRPWLYQIALNAVRTHVRRRAVSTLALDDAPIGHLAGRRDEEPEQVVLTGERQRDLAVALATLPWRYREAIVLRHVQGLSYEETARVLGQPIGTTKSDVHRGLHLLREMLTAELLLEAAGSRG